jgi:hypothetical protein
LIRTYSFYIDTDVKKYISIGEGNFGSNDLDPPLSWAFYDNYNSKDDCLYWYITEVITG